MFSDLYNCVVKNVWKVPWCQQCHIFSFFIVKAQTLCFAMYRIKCRWENCLGRGEKIKKKINFYKIRKTNGLKEISTLYKILPFFCIRSFFFKNLTKFQYLKQCPYYHQKIGTTIYYCQNQEEPAYTRVLNFSKFFRSFVRSSVSTMPIQILHRHYTLDPNILVYRF